MAKLDISIILLELNILKIKSSLYHQMHLHPITIEVSIYINQANNL